MMKETSFLTEQDLKAYELFAKYKLSVSRVKYSRGHDGDCMSANLKIGSKIVGAVWDDSWGGGYDYKGERIGEFLAILKEISKEIGSWDFRGMEMDYNDDMLVYLLVEYTREKRDAKKKTLFMISKTDPSQTEGPEELPKEFTYTAPFETLTMEKIHDLFKKKEEEGYKYMEVVNKRFA